MRLALRSDLRNRTWVGNALRRGVGVWLGCDGGFWTMKRGLDLEDWVARLVEIVDSVSVVSYEESVDELNDWRDLPKPPGGEVNACSGE